MTRAIVFDALGTLFTARRVPTVDALRAAGASAPDPDALAAHVDAAPHGDLEARLRFAYEMEDQAAPDVDKLAQGYWRAQAEALTLLPDVEACFRTIPDSLRIGLLSNWPDGPSMRHALDRAGILSRFDAVVTSGEIGAWKPDPRLFLTALAKLDVQPADALMVGDDLANDLAPARALGMRTALITHPRTPNPTPMPGINHTLGSLTELPNALTPAPT